MSSRSAKRAAKRLEERRHEHDMLRDKDGRKRPGSLNPRKSFPAAKRTTKRRS